MRVLVTGATGYVGSAIAERLALRGCTVVATARSEAAAARLAARRYTVVRGDLSDPGPLAVIARRCDALVHAAFPFEPRDADGMFTPGPRAARRAYHALQVESDAVRAFIEAYRDSGKPLVVLTGTGSFGDTGDSFPDETHAVPATTLFGLRGRMEHDVVAAADLGVRGTVVRAASVFGRGGSMLVPFLLASARRLGAAFVVAGSEQHCWSFVHVDDLADLCARALTQTGLPGILHGADARVLHTIDIAAAIHCAIGAPGSPLSLSLEDALGRCGDLARFWSVNNCVTPAQSYRIGWRPRAGTVMDDIVSGSYAAPAMA